MKTIKSILIATTLICTSLVSMLSAQEAQNQEHKFKVAIGDSVMIKRECTSPARLRPYGCGTRYTPCVS